MVDHTCNPSTQEAEAGALTIQGRLSYIARPCLKTKAEIKIDIKLYLLK
jgi:hypothetical protein